VETTNQPTVKFPDRFKVRGDRAHPSSQGMVCVKGATIAESIQKDRLLHPMMRDRLDDEFRQVSWDEALDAIVRQMQHAIASKGADALCMYGSGQFQTEDYYIAQKLFKGCLGTNNFDANSRLCMSSAVSGYAKSFGSDGPPCCYEDLDITDCLFAIGTNSAECHPIIFNRFRKHHKKNPHVKLIVVDPRRTQTAEVADLHLAIQPGTDIDLLNGIDKYIETKDISYINKLTDLYKNKSLIKYGFIFIILVYVYYLILHLAIDGGGWKKYGFIFFILLFFIPFILIYDNLEILFSDFSNEKFNSKNIQKYLKNGCNNLLGLIIKYNYPCVEK
jgi:anaerobic selenocysteine-containing dehydrogenase